VVVLCLVPLLCDCAARSSRVTEEEWEGPPRALRLSDRPVERSARREGTALPPSAREGLPDALGDDKKVNQDSAFEDQNETAIVIDPTNPQRLVVAWNDYATGDSRNTIIGYGWSTDGGVTWESSAYDPPALAGVSTGDPTLTADGDGNVYLGILAYGNQAANGIYCAKSTDGGVTFGDPVQVDVGGDKEYLAVDPETGRLVIVWFNSGNPGGSIFYSMSFDGNASWTAPLQISDTVLSEQNGPVPAIGPGGEIYVAWTDFSGDRILFDRSLDGGGTWVGPDIEVTDVMQSGDLSGAGPFRNPLLVGMAVDRSEGPYRGNIYVVWSDARFGDPDILVAVSANGGASWRAPARINDDSQGNGIDQFQPWVAVDGTGRVHVSWMDKRRDRLNFEVDAYTALSADGGLSWGPNVRVSDVGTTAISVSTAGFFGDYTGLAAGRNFAYPAFPDSRLGTQDIWVDRIDARDYDDDGVLNDGDSSGRLDDLPCLPGQAGGCDDNCPGDANPGQEDLDLDGVGDACDLCPADGDPDQEDVDADGFGDACDTCPFTIDPAQQDTDGDGAGNLCDNCPLLFNPGQEPLVFHAVTATSPVELSWGEAADVEWVGGPLQFLSSYALSYVGELFTATGLDIGFDAPPPGQGTYYLVKYRGDCGSWQTAAGAEPARDTILP
jgi:hypothetical protein